jgi:hypothetical protein
VIAMFELLGDVLMLAVALGAVGMATLMEL